VQSPLGSAPVRAGLQLSRQFFILFFFCLARRVSAPISGLRCRALARFLLVQRAARSCSNSVAQSPGKGVRAPALSSVSPAQANSPSPRLYCSRFELFDFFSRCVSIILELVSVMFLSCRIKNLEVLWFQLFSSGDFSNALTRSSVKCIRGLKLSFDLIFITSLTRILTSINSCFRCGS
jgi:hypothetical protein